MKSLILLFAMFFININALHSSEVGTPNLTQNFEMMEGDMIVEKRGESSRIGFNLAPDLSVQRWPNNTLIYQFDPSVSNNQALKNTISEAINLIEGQTNLKFKMRSVEANYINITSFNEGCFAYLGMLGGKQQLNLQTNACLHTGVAMHEFLHAAGVLHEQSRPDRDDYITINWSNIPTDWKRQFKLKISISTNFPYDYDSIMHYGSFYSFGINPSTPIMTKNDGSPIIPNRSHLTQTDIKTLNAFYPPLNQRRILNHGAKINIKSQNQHENGNYYYFRMIDNSGNVHGQHRVGPDANNQETFVIERVLGQGNVRHGDKIHIRSQNQHVNGNYYYFRMVGNSGNVVGQDRVGPDTNNQETFVIERFVGYGDVRSGDRIRIRSQNQHVDGFYYYFRMMGSNENVVGHDRVGPNIDNEETFIIETAD